MAEARKPKSSAQALLATAPHTLNGTAWLEQHEALAHHMLHMMTRALVKPAGRATDAMLQSVTQAHAALRIHAKQVLGGAVPVVLATDGRQTMHADILAMLTRRLGEFTAGSKHYPQTAGKLAQAATVLKVARKHIQEIPT